MKTFDEAEKLIKETIHRCDIIGIRKDVSPEAKLAMQDRAINEKTDFYTILVKGRVIIKDYNETKQPQDFIEYMTNGSIVFEYKNTIITMKQIKTE